MKRTFCIFWVCIIGTAGFAGSMTDIYYQLADLGSGRWEYTYEVVNRCLNIDGSPAPIEEFTIWFDPGLYDNLAVTTSEPLMSDWDQIAWQPERVIGDPGAFDALVIGSYPGILPGERAAGFSVSFDWLGDANPGAQAYQVVNPLTFQPIDSGFTIPEPGMLAIVAVGALALVRKRKR